jgi:hypothetical protein
MAYRHTDRYAGNWYVKDGRLVITRSAAGIYEHASGGSAFSRKDKFERFTITRHAVGGWCWYNSKESPEGRPAWPTKRQAVEDLQVRLYGRGSLDDTANV